MRRGRKRWIEGGRRVEKEGGREGGEGREGKFSIQSFGPSMKLVVGGRNSSTRSG